MKEEKTIGSNVFSLDKLWTNKQKDYKDILE